MTPTPRQGTIRQVDARPGRRHALLRDADIAMYAAKAGGRDQVVGAGEHVPG